jgi:hypothetical protein
MRLLSFLSLISLVAGCSMFTQPAVSREARIQPAATNVIVEVRPTLVVTNWVTAPGQTSAVPVMVTNWMVTTNVIVQPPATNWVSVTNWVVNPELSAGVESVRRLNSALNPTPTAPLVDWGLTGLAGVAGIIAAWQSRRANRVGLVADTVIRAVETFPGATPIKRHVERVSALTGCADELAERVETATAQIAEMMGDGQLDALELLRLARDRAVRVEDVPAIYREAFTVLRAGVPV